MRIAELELIIKAAKAEGMVNVTFYRPESRTSEVVLDVADRADISDNPVLYQSGDTLQIPLVDMD